MLGAAFVLFSPAFHAGRPIPPRYTCDGLGSSPPLAWTAPPARTRSFALRVYDGDARGFTHWLAWGFSPTARGLAAGAHAPRAGTNDFGQRGWGPPCPPPGSAHHYAFVLYALAKPLALEPGAGTAAFFARLRSTSLRARTILIGTYRRR